jgi:hypothetical protein
MPPDCPEVSMARISIFSEIPDPELVEGEGSLYQE